jgi:polar amino acid transport system ATP-binding protein
MNAEIEAFCEKQILPKKTRQKVLLLVEELLQIYQPLLDRTLLDLTLSYSEKKESLELVLESTGEAVNPLDKNLLPDDLGLNIINSLAESIDYQRVDNKNKLILMMKKSL